MSAFNNANDLAFVCGAMPTRNDARMERAIDTGFLSVRIRIPPSGITEEEEKQHTRMISRMEEGIKTHHVAVRAPRAANNVTFRTRKVNIYDLL